MKSDRIAQQWQSYRKEVIPPNASAIQVSECKKAFYAGAIGFFTAMNQINLDDENQAADAVQAMVEEIQEFGQQMAGEHN